MTPRRVLTRTIVDGWRSLAGFGGYIVLLVSVIVAIYPSLGHNESLAKLVKSYPGTLKAFIGFGGVVDYSTGVGYLGIEIFSLMLPGLLIAAAVAAGGRAIAGEEEQHTLDLLLANPVSRRQVVLEKAGALLCLVAVLAAVAFATLSVSGAIAGLDVSVAHLAAGSAGAGLLALFFGALALAVSAATGNRALALAVGGGAAAAAYLANALGTLVPGLSPLRQASPFYQYAAVDPLRHGLTLAHAAPLLLGAIVLAAAAVLCLERRDLA